MPSRSGIDRAPRTILLIGILLAAILVGLELSRSEEPHAIAAEGTIAGPSGDRVRVLLGRRGAGPWTIELEDGIAVADDPGHPRRFRAALAEGVLLIDGRARPGRFETSPGDFQIDGHAYRGRLLLDATLGPRRPLLELPLESYLAQVLPGEMPMSYPAEALSAQVVAARSYVVTRIERRRARAFDVTDSETSQMFEPLSRETGRATKIVALSRGLVLAEGDRILPAYYSANCGGRTRSNAEAFGEESRAALAGVDCGHCGWSRHHDWMAVLPAAEVGAWFDLGGPVTEVRVLRGEGSGYENRLLLRGPGASRTVPSSELKRRAGGRLKSSFIVGADLRGDRLRLSGHGFGHGVGLCQNGARGLALAGYEARAILAHYYPGADLRRLEPAENR